MDAPPSRPWAWEPLTPRGVATFAHATSGRLWLVQFLVALIVVAAVVFFLYDGWCPTIREGIEQLPDTGEIRSGKLDWHGASPQLLTEGTFLAFSVDLDHSADVRSPAHLEVEFGRETFRIHSLLGYAEARYPAQWIISFNRQELKPWWGAWQPVLLTGTAVAVLSGLMLLWYALATVYTLPVWLVAFFSNRELKLSESCRLANAALMPGALLMATGIFLYEFGVIDLVGLTFVVVGHLVLGWMYLLVSPLFLPKGSAASASAGNPFVAPMTRSQRRDGGDQKSKA